MTAGRFWPTWVGQVMVTAGLRHQQLARHGGALRVDLKGGGVHGVQDPRGVVHVEADLLGLGRDAGRQALDAQVDLVALEAVAQTQT